MNWIILYNRHTYEDSFNNFDNEFKTCVPVPPEIEDRNDAVKWFCENISVSFGEKYKLVCVSHVENIEDAELEQCYTKLKENRELQQYEELKKQFGE